MAWTDVRYLCGHTERKQLYGTGLERKGRMAWYGQRLCLPCWKAEVATWPEREVKPHVRIGRLGPNGEKSCSIEATGTFDTWQFFEKRGYRLAETSYDMQPIGDYDPVEHAWGPEPGTSYWKLLPPEDLPAEYEWLRTIGARGATDPLIERHVLAPLGRKPLPMWRRAAIDATRTQAAHRHISNALRHAKKPYVSYSGGKDSMATLAMVEAIRPDIPVIWSDDELEYPETIEHLLGLRERIGERLIIAQGHATHGGWFTSWADRPFWRDPLPGTIPIPRLLDDWAIQEGYDLAFLGLRMEESGPREAILGNIGPTYHRKGALVCCPIYDWSAEAVWALIDELPYNAAYDVLRGLDLDERELRVGPLPLTPGDTLRRGWPDLYAGLVGRYGQRWG